MLLTKVGTSIAVSELKGMNTIILIDGGVQLWCMNEDVPVLETLIKHLREYYTKEKNATTGTFIREVPKSEH